nr:hypothetical protein 48 [bacterium]
MATAKGTWIGASNINAGFIDLARRRSKEITEDDLIAFNQRNHHYTFDVDDNGLDINGFIVQTAKPSHPRQKFRVFLDSNENGRFDKKDQLIGRSGLKQKHAAKGVGNLLDEDEIGQLEVKFKTTKSNASMRSYENDSSYDGTMIHRSVMSFADSDNINIVPPTPIYPYIDPIDPIITVPPTLL